MATTTRFEVQHDYEGIPLRFTYQSIPTTENGDPVLSYGAGRRMTVSCLPGTSGKIQYTTSLPTSVAQGTATWFDWARGTVTVATTDTIEGPVTAIRGVAVSGTLEIEVVQ